MTTDSVDRYRQRSANIGTDGRYRSFVKIERRLPRLHTPDSSAHQARDGARAGWIAETKCDARSRLRQLSDETLHRVAIYIAGGLVAGGVVLAARNVGSERHTWWGWLLIGVPVSWLSFLGLVAFTFGALRIVVGALRWSLSLTARMSLPARIALPASLVGLAGAFVLLIGPGTVRHAVAILADFLFPYAIVIAVGGWLAVVTDSHRHDTHRHWPS